MRHVVTIGLAIAALLVAAAASADQTPIALRAPTGYKNFCDGAPHGRLGSIRCPTGGLPQTLWRPLRLPQASAEACPVDSSHRISQEFSPVLGPGPVYLLAGAAPGNVITMTGPTSTFSRVPNSGWGIGALKLPLRNGYNGPFSIRGARIDGPGLLGFSGPAGKRPFSAIQFFRGSVTALTLSRKTRFTGGWIWATTPGCYAAQFDGATFSNVIVFRVAFL